MFFPFLNNLKDLDLSYKTDLDFCDCFRRIKNPSHNRIGVHFKDSDTYISFSLLLNYPLCKRIVFQTGQEVTKQEFTKVGSLYKKEKKTWGCKIMRRSQALGRLCVRVCNKNTNFSPSELTLGKKTISKMTGPFWSPPILSSCIKPFCNLCKMITKSLQPIKSDKRRKK